MGCVFLLEVQYSILKSLISTCVLSYIGSREDWLLDLAPLLVANVNHIGRKRLCCSKTKKYLKIINFINLVSDLCRES